MKCAKSIAEEKHKRRAKGMCQGLKMMKNTSDTVDTTTSTGSTFKLWEDIYEECMSRI